MKKVCDYCKNEYQTGIIETIKCRELTFNLCPNCRTFLITTNGLTLEEAVDLDDDIHGTPGAILFQSGDEEYCLKKDTMERLLTFNLLPEEYKALKKEKYQYMLHGDFYTKEGIALQPITAGSTKPYAMFDLSQMAYELYKQDWLNTHISPERLLKVKRNYVIDCLENDGVLTYFEDWIEEHGFDSEIYACYEEFLECEYEDEEYMIRLLADEKLIALYKNR